MKKTTLIAGLLTLTVVSIGLTSFSSFMKTEKHEITAPVATPENTQGAATESNKAAWN